MIDIVKVVASVVLFSGGSLLVSYCVASYFSARKHRIDLVEGTSVRLIGPGGAYRCHFMGERNENLVFSSPIQADRYVPIRCGEKVYVQAPGDGCMLSFRTTVIQRDSEAHELILASPQYVRRSERRTEHRITSLVGEDALIDGELATIVDLSAAGACLLSRRRPCPGDRLRVVLPSSDLDADAWALDATPAVMGSQQAFKIRVQFTEPLAGLSKQR
jgi:Flagellar protein YcgR